MLKMLLCTQLAPARHVIQVGESNSSNRGCPASRLKSDFKVEIAVSEMTLPRAAVGAAGPEADPAPLADAGPLADPGPEADPWPEAAEVHEARTRKADATTANPRPMRQPG